MRTGGNNESRERGMAAGDGNRGVMVVKTMGKTIDAGVRKSGIEKKGVVVKKGCRVGRLRCWR